MARILITGCSTGIGRAAAIELTKRGHEVVATARRPETLADLDVAQALALDVDDDTSVAAAIGDAGQLDALVNNAGFGVTGPVERVPVSEGKRIFETNFFGALRMIQAVLPDWRARGSGTVVNVSSVAGRVGAPLDGLYSATKFALEAVSEALHYEVGHFGIRVRIVEPGEFETGFSANTVRHGLDTPPYDELDREWGAARAKLIGGGDAPGPEAVAVTIADAVEYDGPRLRWPVGSDADLVLGARASMDDEAFERAMRDVLGVEW
ncbi:MAG TPA: SDR family oxidoreductase [Acidimicrobiia bacterium]|nr:SDR family oxidoreductase [Acidimicrobiia bacterium]